MWNKTGMQGREYIVHQRIYLPLIYIIRSDDTIWYAKYRIYWYISAVFLICTWNVTMLNIENCPLIDTVEFVHFICASRYKRFHYLSLCSLDLCSFYSVIIPLQRSCAFCLGHKNEPDVQVDELIVDWTIQ
jgi:hypothetical protein